MSLTWSGFSQGRCESSSAAAPETTAAACEVPLPLKNAAVQRAGVAVHDVDERARGPQADDRGAGRDQVGGPLALEDGAALRERGHPVVGAVGRALRVHGADGQHGRVVRRVGQPGGGPAAVAGRDDHHDAAVPGDLGRVGQRVEPVVLRRVGAERQVEHPDVQAGVAGVRHDPVDGGDDLRHVGVALRVGQLEAHDPRAGRHAEVASVLRRVRRGRRAGVAAGDDAGHVRAVTEGVQTLKGRATATRARGPDR